MGALSSFAQAHLSGNSHVHLVSTDVLYLFTSCLGTQLRAKPPAFVVVPVPSFPRAEQLLLVLMHEFPNLSVHETQPFVLSIFMDDAADPVCILRSLPRLLWRLGAPMFPFAPSFRSCLRHRPRHADACRCICFATAPPTCRALVVVRTLALTNPGPPSSHAASPYMHKSATAARVPGMTVIFTTRFILELASDVNSSTKYRPCAACASYISHRNSICSR